MTARKKATGRVELQFLQWLRDESEASRIRSEDFRLGLAGRAREFHAAVVYELCWVRLRQMMEEAAIKPARRRAKGAKR